MPDSAANPPEHRRQPRDVQESGCRIGESRFEQDVVRLVAAQDIVDQVGRDGDRVLPAIELVSSCNNLGYISDDFGC